MSVPAQEDISFAKGRGRLVVKNMPVRCIDDFAVERSTEYANEIVKNVIEMRYKSGKPLIVTTNLTLKELQNPGADRARIYDRVLAMCTPVFFHGKSHRIGDRTRKYRECKDIFEEPQK